MFHSAEARFVNGITLNVKNLAALRPFYEDVIGFQVVTASINCVQYDVGLSHHILTLQEISSGREPQLTEAGLFYIGILLPHNSDLANLMVQFSDFDIPMNGGEQSTSTSLFVEDPEGNMLKFYVDYPLEDWLYRTHLHSMHIKAMNIPKLLSYTTEVGWQGIPKDTKIGNIHLKTTRLSEVEQYYKAYFGLKKSAQLDKMSLFLASQYYHHHIALNHWISRVKRVDNEHTYGLALIDFYYPEITHLWLKGPDGLQFRFNFIKVES